MSADAAAGEEAAAGKKGFFANLPRDPNYEGFEGVVRYYLPTNDKVCVAGRCRARRGWPSCGDGCPCVLLCPQFVMFVVSNYVAVIGFVIMKKKASAAAEAARAPPPAYPEFAKGGHRPVPHTVPRGRCNCRSPTCPLIVPWSSELAKMA